MESFIGTVRNDIVISKQIQSFYESRKVLLGKKCFENFCGSLLELNLCMKDCQGSCSVIFVSQDLESQH